MSRLIGCASIAILLASGCGSPQPAPKRAARAFYIDCAAGDDSRDAATEAAAWKTTARVNREVFAPGDRILFRRGGRCPGGLEPRGSGTPSHPIRLGAWGDGPRPIVEAKGKMAALRLYDQQGWEVESLEFSGGSINGVMVSGSRRGVLRHFRFRDLRIRGVRGSAATKRRGGLSIAPEIDGLTFSGIVVDGVEVFDVTQWAGIVVDGGYPPSRLEEVQSRWRRLLYRYRRPPDTFAENVVVRNSVVHDVAGDPIVLFRVRHGVVESNVAWRGGMQEYYLVPGQNPNAMWVLNCHDCAIRGNQAFWMDSPGVDAGAFDIDWGCSNTVIEDNYGHDNQGYCLALFGARERVTRDSILRRNVCIANGRSPRLARRQGDLVLATWDGGSLDGFEVHDNLFVWDPPFGAPLAIYRDWNAKRIVTPGAKPRLIRDNVALTSAPFFGDRLGVVTDRDNAVWGRGDPNRPDLARRFGFAGIPAANGPVQLTVRLDPEREPRSRRLALSALAAAEQFAALGLTLAFSIAPNAPPHLEFDWGLDGRITRREAVAPPAASLQDGARTLRAWTQPPSPAELGLTLRRVLGDPPGSIPVSWALSDAR